MMYPSLAGAKQISIDLETKDPDIKTTRLSAIKRTGYVLGFSVGTDDGFKAYYPLRHPGEGNADFDTAVRWLADQMALDIPKVGANVAYDLEWLWFGLGIKVNGPKICVQATEALINENQKSFSLETLSRKYLNRSKDESLLRQEAARLGIQPEEIKANLWQFPAAAVAPYGEADANLPIEIAALQAREIDAQGLRQAFELESQVLDVLLEMRKHGVRVDQEKALSLSADLRKKEEAALCGILKIVGRDVDVWSGQDIARACEKLKLAYPVTEKNNPSFCSDWLKAQEHPFFKEVKNARRYNRINETFVKSKALECCHEGRVYPSYFSTRSDSNGTVTGRLSSSNPNMQQVPARDEELAPLVRGIFLPEPGEEWEIYDYSQQEPRVTVHYATILKLPGADKARRQYIDNPDTDYHQMVADMAGITRKHAKTINLGLAYGMGKAKLAVELGVTYQEANELFNKYHEAVPYVRLLTDRCTALAAERGWVKTVFDRRRHFDLWGPTRYEKGMTPMSREEAEAIYGRSICRWFTYRAANNIIQGSSAEMVKKAMVEVFRETGKAPVVTVHDENDYSNADRETSRKIMKIMETCVKLEVPLKLDYERGPSWGEAKEEKL